MLSSSPQRTPVLRHEQVQHLYCLSRSGPPGVALTEEALVQKAGSYGQFCPVAMAAEVVCTRWTPLILRELVAGSMRFNDLRRGLPRISPTLLSKRLKELEGAGVVQHAHSPQDGNGEYRLTPAGEELKAIIFELGIWGQRWIETQTSLKNLDPSLLMWDMRRNIDPNPLPPRRCVIQFLYLELSMGQTQLVADRRGE
jgi:DNA-binding HxlR family transcriptional regulator